MEIFNYKCKQWTYTIAITTLPAGVVWIILVTTATKKINDKKLDSPITELTY